MHFDDDYSSADDGEITSFMEPSNPQGCGWMDDRWNEDEYEFGVIDTSGFAGMSRSAGERMDTPMNHVEV